MAAWAGLGYYARARNLLACARVVARDHGGVFPDSEAGLLALPGVGAYTAAAVAAIAFDRPANVVDGNVERVIARLYMVEAPLPAAKPELKALAASLVDDHRPGDWAQALMDLGAVICRPKAPLCERCPVGGDLRGVGRRRARKLSAAIGQGRPAPPLRRGLSADARRPRRPGAPPARGSAGRHAGPADQRLARRRPGRRPRPRRRPRRRDPGAEVGEIEHVFTHFALTLQVWRAEAGDEGAEVIWSGYEDLAGLPSVFLKAARTGLPPLG